MIGPRRSRLRFWSPLVALLALVSVLVLAVTVSLAAVVGVGSIGGVGGVLDAESGGGVGVDGAGAGLGPTASQQVGGANVTPISGCETITEPGRYVLTRDIINTPGPRTTQNCVWVNASDVVLDGNGHRIDGIGVSDSTGVYVGSKADIDNVTVRNVTLSDWHKGVWHRGVSNGTFRNVNATNNAIGIGVENASGTRVLDNEASTNLIGIRVTDSTLAALAGNEVSGNYGTGIYDELPTVDVLDERVAVGPPLDPDDDGRYEDVTGDRETGVYDALSLFGVVSADLAGLADLHADHREMLDMDGDGDLDYGDVWTLLSS
jgi:parallel beta-helix repeat protein